MKRLVVILCLVALAGCAVAWKQCRPGSSVEMRKDCAFKVDDPLACMAVLWLKVSCPVE